MKTIQCPDCQTVLESETALVAGEWLTCPACDAGFQAPDAAKSKLATAKAAPPKLSWLKARQPEVEKTIVSLFRIGSMGMAILLGALGLVFWPLLVPAFICFVLAIVIKDFK